MKTLTKKDKAKITALMRRYGLNKADAPQAHIQSGI